MISVLMRTHVNDDNPTFLGVALESVFAQTVLPDQLVLVIEGPISASNGTLITKYKNDTRIQSVDIVSLPDRDFRDAMNIGIAACKGLWIMQMDSNSRSRSDRLEVQLDYAKRYP